MQNKQQQKTAHTKASKDRQQSRIQFNSKSINHIRCVTCCVWTIKKKKAGNYFSAFFLNLTIRYLIDSLVNHEQLNQIKSNVKREWALNREKEKKKRDHFENDSFKSYDRQNAREVEGEWCDSVYWVVVFVLFEMQMLWFSDLFSLLLVRPIQLNNYNKLIQTQFSCYSIRKSMGSYDCISSYVIGIGKWKINNNSCKML